MPITHLLRGSVLHCLCLLLMLASTPPAFGAEAAKTKTASASKYAAEAEYQKKADACYQLEQNPSLGRRREDWLAVAQDLEQVCAKQPAGRNVPACLHLSGRMRRNMHLRFSHDADQKQALALFGKVISAFPNSPEAADSLYALGQIEQARGNLRTAAKIYADVIARYPFSAKKAEAEGQLRNLKEIAASLSAKNQQASALVPQAMPKPAQQAARQLTAKPVAPAPRPTVTVTQVPVQLSAQENKFQAAPPAKPVMEKAAAELPKPALKVVKLGSSEQRQAAAPTQNNAVQEPARARLALPAVEKAAEPTAKVEKEGDSASGLLSNLTDWKNAIFGGAEQPAQKTAAEPKKEEAISAPKTEKAAQDKTPAIASARPASVPVLTPPVPQPKNSAAASNAAAAAVATALKRESAALDNALPEPARQQEKAVLPEPPKSAESAKPKALEPPAAKIVLSELKIADLSKVRDEMPTSPMAAEAAAPSPPPDAAVKKEEERRQPELISILPAQHWSSDKYSRVAVAASSPAAFHAELPSKDSGHPGRVTIEFKQSRVGEEVRSPIALAGGLIKEIRTEQTDAATVKVALELEAGTDCKVFSLSNPFRVVVDIRKFEETVAASSAEKVPAAAEKTVTAKKSETVAAKPWPTGSAADLSLAQQLGLGVRRIVIDPGHGGKDAGAEGFGLQEKRIVLQVAEKVRAILKKEHNYEIVLTREGDSFLPLEERTAIANTKGADIFLSIHVNAHPKEAVKGVETFYLNLATNPEAMRVAALENATSTHSISEMQDILADLLKNTKINESSQLADFIQTAMIDGLRQRKYQVKDLGVKQAPFYVLIGAQMPAVLVEISFLSNPKEAELLKQEQYLQTVAEQIAAGLITYIEHRRTAALPLRPRH